MIQYKQKSQKMITYLKLIFASILTIFLVLLSWRNTYDYNCYMLIFPIMLLLIISHSFIELKMKERLCFKSCYFKANSFFAKLLSSKVAVTIFYILVSIMMSISALSGVIEYPKELWIYLLIHTLLMIFLYKYFYYIFKSTIRDSYRSILAREWAINIGAIFLIGVFIYISLNGYEPKYMQSTLHETIIVASNSIVSSCSIVNYILKFKIEVDSLFWWIITQSSDGIHNQLAQLGIWLGFLFMNSLALLGVNRFMAQIIYLLDKLFKRRQS